MKKNSNNLRYGIYGSLLIVAFLFGTQYNSLISGDSVYEQLNKFKDVLLLTEKYYVDDVDTQKLTEGAIEGLLKNLDPHSVYIPPKQLSKVNEEFKGKFEGIGIEFQLLNDTITVLQPIGGGPSAQVGIMSNDKIVKIDGKNAVKYNNEQVMKSLKGPKGTKVSVSIFRSGIKELLEFEIIRDVIPLYSVDVSFMTRKDIGYISVSRFSETTADEMRTALLKLKNLGMEQLILDLRFNPGGFLDQAVKMVDEFLDGGKENRKKVVYTKGRRAEFDEEYFASSNSEFEKIPIVVLLSNNSASASEIVAGAIQDWDRGLIVGETSFGKGLVQRQFDLNDRSAFRLTISRYYTPSGRLIQRSYSDGVEKYQREAFERDEKEGENIAHTAEKDSINPIFYTTAGRKIYGGGGITPDFIVKPLTMTSYTTNLFRKNIFYEYVAQYLSGNGQNFKDKYKSFEDFNLNYKIEDEFVNNFVEFGIKKGTELKKEEFEKDKEFIRMRLKAFIARNFWGNEGWYPIVLSEDNQLQKAIDVLPEAAKIAHLK
ncbi:MAG: S41 family peptidase [Bacteroidota bacterium]